MLATEDVAPELSMTMIKIHSKCKYSNDHIRQNANINGIFIIILKWLSTLPSWGDTLYMYFNGQNKLTSEKNVNVHRKF